MVEWDNVQTLWQIRSICVNDILEILGEAIVEWIKVHSAMNNPEQSKEFIRRQIFDDLVLELLVYVLVVLLIWLEGT